MRLLVAGAGATGGYFGGRLAHAGRDVTFLVRSGRAAQLQASGLEVVSPHGGFTLTPKLVSAGTIEGPYDAILVAVKAFSLDSVLADLAPAVGPETMILPVLNGMKHVETLTARFGPEAVVGCLCRIPAHVDEQGRVVQLGKFHDLVYGEMSGERSARIEQLDAFMHGAGFTPIFRPRLNARCGRNGSCWRLWPASLA